MNYKLNRHLSNIVLCFL